MVNLMMNDCFRACPSPSCFLFPLNHDITLATDYDRCTWGVASSTACESWSSTARVRWRCRDTSYTLEFHGIKPPEWSGVMSVTLGTVLWCVLCNSMTHMHVFLVALPHWPAREPCRSSPAWRRPTMLPFGRHTSIACKTRHVMPWPMGTPR